MTDDLAAARFADVLAALGAEARLRILRLLLAAYPQGVVAGDLATELRLAPSTLSHHLERLRAQRIVSVRREGTFLRYFADVDTLRDLLAFFFAECCARNRAIDPCAILPTEMKNDRPSP